MKNFLKGIVTGIGGVAPGLNGCVILIIFGLYEKVLNALGTIFRNFKKNIKFLLPIVLGMFVGVLVFSKIVDFFLTEYEIQTRYLFLGLIIGTIPLLYKEVKKKNFSVKYYPIIILSIILGTYLLKFNLNIPPITTPNIFEKIFLGILVAATAIIPGVEPAVIMSGFGYYELYVNSLATFDLSVLLPMLIGLTLGGILISYGISILFEKCYSLTMSVIFGMFLAMIPSILNSNCILGRNLTSLASITLLILGFAISYYLGDMENHNKLIKKYLKGGNVND